MDYKEIFKNIQKGQINNLYLFYGEEKYLIDSAIQKVTEKLISQAMEAFNYSQIDEGDLSAQRIIELCETIPLMDNNRIIVVRNYPFTSKQSDGAETQLSEYIIKGIPSFSYLIFAVNGDVDKRKKLYKEVKKHGETVEFGRISQGDLEKWVVSKFKSANKEITVNDLKYFISLLDYGSKNSELRLEDVDNEVQKLISYIGEKKTIGIEAINVITSKSINSDIFRLIDFIGKREGYNALKTLDEIIYRGEPVAKIIFMIARQFRILLQCKTLLDKGYSQQEIASKLSLHPFVVKTAVGQGRSFSNQTIKKSLQACLDTDTSIKKGLAKDRISVESLIAKLSIL